MRSRHERGALASGRDIRGTKVGDGGDTGSNRDERGLADLQRDPPPLRVVMQGMPVTTDEVDRGERGASLATEPGHGRSLTLANVAPKRRQLRGTDRRAVGCRQQAPTHRWRIGNVSKCFELDREADRSAPDSNERRIKTVGRGARHESDGPQDVLRCSG